MKKIAVLLTCHNRKDKTIKCLDSLFKAKNNLNKIEILVYLTDDGSIDGTSEAVKRDFPSVKILPGSGSLYWTGGMMNSWKEAMRDDCFDAFLLLNDDTFVSTDCFIELIKANAFSMSHYGKRGIYVGSVKDPNLNKHIYGGRKLVNKWTFKTIPIIPNGNIQECQFGNGNIMLICTEVVSDIGILCKNYVHGKADYDYTLRAKEKNIPVLVCENYCGHGYNDHPSFEYKRMNLKERINYLYSPKGIEFSGYMYFMWRFFPWRAPFVFCSLWLKTFFPGFSRISSLILNRT